MTAQAPRPGSTETNAQGGDGTRGTQSGARALRVTVVEPLGTGGMIHYAYGLCDGLARAGAAVTLLTSSDYELDALPHSFAVEKRLRLWPHHDARRAEAHEWSRARRAVGRLGRGFRRVARAGRLVRAWIVVVRALDDDAADIVQFGSIRSPLDGLFLRLLSRRAFLLSDVCHEPELRERASSGVAAILSRISGATYSNFDAVFVHGAYNRDLFCRLHPDLADRTFSIRHGNQQVFELLARIDGGVSRDLRRRYGLREGEGAVVYFGHLVPSKGVDLLVRAHALAFPRTGVPLVIAGYPSKLFDAGELMRLVSDLGVVDSVALDLRYVPGSEVPALMELAKVVVLPYRSATQSGALQLAYTFGRPVIATRVGGLPEVVEEGRSGLLVEPESPVELARAIEAILTSPGRAEAMGEYARELATGTFSWDATATELIEVYERLLSRRVS